MPGLLYSPATDGGDDPRQTGLLAPPPMAPIDNPIRLRGVTSAAGAQPATAVPMPGTKKPSLLSRIASGVSRFNPFPISPEYADLFDPEQQNYLRSQAQLKLAMGLLSQSGPQPRGTSNIGTRIAAATAGVDWNDMQTGMAQNVMAINQYALQLNKLRSLQTIVNKYPAQPNETPSQVGVRLARMIPELIASGNTEAAEHLSDVLKALNPQDWTIKEVVGPDGVKRYVRVNSATGATMPVSPTGAPISSAGAPGAPDAGAAGAPAVPGAPAAPAPDDGSGMVPGDVPQQNFERENSLRQEYQTAVKDYRTRADLLQSAIEQAGPARKGDPIAQDQLVTAAAAAMQGGVAGGGRGEALLSLIEHSKPLWNKVAAILQHAKGQATVLQPDEVDEIVGLLKQQHRSVTRQWGDIYQSYRTGAQRALVNPQAIFPAPPTSYPAETSPTSGGPATRRLRGLLGPRP